MLDNTGTRSRYLRVHSISVDEYGVDPLRDRALRVLPTIRDYDVHRVTQAQRGALDLISLERYGTDELWWVIQAYNGIASYREVVEGLTLKIPRLASVMEIFTLAIPKPSTVQRVISI
jgi:hypothetical protein